MIGMKVCNIICVCVFVAAQFVQSASMSTPGEQKQEFVLEVDVDV